MSNRRKKNTNLWLFRILYQLLFFYVASVGWGMEQAAVNVDGDVIVAAASPDFVVEIDVKNMAGPMSVLLLKPYRPHA